MFRALATTALLMGAGMTAAMAQELPNSPMALTKTFEQRFNARDLDGLAALYRKEGILVSESGAPLSGAEKIRGEMAKFLSVGLPIKVTVRQVYQADGTALIITDWLMEGKDAQGRQTRMNGTSTDVATRRPDGKWQYAIDNPRGLEATAQ
ncbi:YybH family protein [Achromobacter aegrifaciens]